MNLKLVPNEKQYWEFIRLLRADKRVQSGFIQNTSKISQEQQEKYMEKYNDNYYICLNEDKIVGYCWYLKQTILPYGGYCYGYEEKPYIWVHSIYTDPAMSRKGVASLLYSKLEEIAKDNNVEKIYLDIFRKNVVSEKFHYKHGFKKDIIIYSKKL